MPSPIVGVRFSRADRQKLVKLARANGTTLSSVLRDLIKARLSAMHGGPDDSDTVAEVAKALGMPLDAAPRDVVLALQELVNGLDAEASQDPLDSGGADSPPTTGAALGACTNLKCTGKCKDHCRGTSDTVALRALNKPGGYPLNATEQALAKNMSVIEREQYTELRRLAAVNQYKQNMIRAAQKESR